MREVPNPNDYPAGEKSAENREKEIRKVITGNVKVQKKSLGYKFREIFQLRDLSEIKSYIYQDLIVPGFKKAVRGIVDIILDGEVRSYSTKSNGYVNYRGMSERREKEEPRYVSKKKKDFRELIFETRGDAEEVLSTMVDLISEYRHVSIADLYDCCDITSDFADNKYGWEDLSGSSVKRISDGYILDLPSARALD